MAQIQYSPQEFPKEVIKEALNPVRHPVDVAVYGVGNYFNLATIIRTCHSFLVRRIYVIDSEGFYEKGQKVVVIEDLISTGKSSLQVVDVLKNEGLHVEGMVSIFTYGFDVADKAFNEAGVPYQSLTNYSSLIELAIEKGLVTTEQQDTLLNWRKNPADWGR